MMSTYEQSEESPDTRREGAPRFDENEAAWFDSGHHPITQDKIRAALRSSAPPPPVAPPPIGDDEVDGWLAARPSVRG